MTTSPATTLYAQRRARLAAQLAPGGIAILPTAPEQQRNRDSDFLFRHDSYFYYLTGFTEPNAWLVITAEGESTLFCNPKDPEREIWDGIRLGPAAAPDALGVQAAFPVTELEQRLPKLLENRSVVWYPFAIHQGLDARINGWLQPVRARVRYGALCPEQQRDLCGPLDDMRLIKDTHEQDTMRRAAQISARAHVRAMQRCAAMLREGQDVREYHLDAELLHEFRPAGLAVPGLRQHRRRRRQRLRAALPRRRRTHPKWRARADRCRLRARRLRERHHPHLPREWQIHRAAAHAVRPGAGLAGSGRGRHESRRALH